MIVQYLDLTDEFANSFNGRRYSVTFEASNYSYALVQFIEFNSEVTFSSTIDSGSIQGVTDGNILTSDNYFLVAATYLLDNTLSPYSPDNGIYRLDIVGRYIKLENNDGIDTFRGKLLVMLVKAKSKIGLMF
jgi:hypothetical protein